MIGANPGSTEAVPINGGYFYGAISEIAVFTSVLSENEISENYNNVIKHNYNATNVLSHIKFEGNNASLKNGASYTSDGVAFDGVNDYLSA